MEIRGNQTESPTPGLHHIKIPVHPDQSNDDRIAIPGSPGQTRTVLMAGTGAGEPYWIPATCCSTFCESLVPLHFELSQFAKSAEEGKMENKDRRRWGLSSKLCTLCSTSLTNYDEVSDQNHALHCVYTTLPIIVTAY